jgi:predicted nuclease of predicted toxin-antitoxin system
VRFLIDQDVYEVTARVLEGLGHGVLRVRDAGLAQAPDKGILRFAYGDGRVLVTRDKDHH